MHQLVHWCIWQIKKLRGQVSSLYAEVGRLSRSSSSSTATMSAAFQQVFFNAGDPNGVVTVPHAFPAICIDTTNNVTWTRAGGATGNTGWGE